MYHRLYTIAVPFDTCVFLQRVSHRRRRSNRFMCFTDDCIYMYVCLTACSFPSVYWMYASLPCQRRFGHATARSTVWPFLCKLTVYRRGIIKLCGCMYYCGVLFYMRRIVLGFVAVRLLFMNDFMRRNCLRVKGCSRFTYFIIVWEEEEEECLTASMQPNAVCIDFVLVKRLWVSWFPRLRFCGRCRNLEVTIAMTNFP